MGCEKKQKLQNKLQREPQRVAPRWRGAERVLPPSLLVCCSSGCWCVAAEGGCKGTEPRLRLTEDKLEGGHLGGGSGHFNKREERRCRRVAGEERDGARK